MQPTPQAVWLDVVHGSDTSTLPFVDNWVLGDNSTTYSQQVVNCLRQEVVYVILKYQVVVVPPLVGLFGIFILCRVVQVVTR